MKMNREERISQAMEVYEVDRETAELQLEVEDHRNTHEGIVAYYNLEQMVKNKYNSEDHDILFDTAAEFSYNYDLEGKLEAYEKSLAENK